MKNYREIISDERIEQVLENSYSVEAGEQLDKGWKLFQKAPGELIGFTIIFLIISGVVGSLSENIGDFLSSVIAAPLSAGYYIHSFQNDKNQINKFENFFEGFKHFVDLFVVLILTTIVQFLVAIPIMFWMYSMSEQSIFSVDTDTFLFELFSSIFQDEGKSTILISLSILTLLAYIYVAISYMFAPMLVLFSSKRGWEAMETSRLVVQKNFFGIFGFVLLLGLVIILGLLCLIIGLLVAIPVSILATYALFDHIFQMDKLQDSDEEILDHLI